MTASNELYAILQECDTLKAHLARMRPLPAEALRKIEDALAIEYTYESNRIEGNTLTLKETESKIPDVLSEDMVVLKSRSYNAFVNGKSVRIVEDNTNGVLLASDHDVWLPVSFLEDYLNISCDGADKTNHYGMEYVKANSLIENSGKKITVCSDGLVVIADSIIEDENVLRTLYNSLM